ncbi:hypothetical protein [Sinorhizobium psoraleae]|uniref:hypothetical protein n=1 Tax=Sinorhizobium psoraleae TaxID=520838 RepID=UPI00156A29DD|nr:hypothetical protein [Sinorhizobium psoraleae]
MHLTELKVTSVARLFGIFAISLSGLTGCSPSDRDFALNGAGTDLMSPKTVAATDGIDAYFGEICRQADLPVNGPRPLRCQTSGFDEYAWHSVAKAGLNDIDHRCDLYLAWLENKRNERPFVESTLTSIGATTAGVLGIAAPGSDALSYVALALGFASQTYSAFYTRALLGIEPSTIKLTVEGRRLAFRETFLNARYREKADVVFVLRSYLKLCTPQTITMDVNTFARAAVTGETPPQFTNLALERQTLGTIRPVSGPAIIERRPAPVPSKHVSDAFTGPNYNDAHLTSLRQKLCVRPPDPDNSKTMTAIKMWEDAAHGANPDSQYKNGRVDDREWNGVGQQRGLRNLETCAPRFQDIGERFVLESPGREAALIKSLKHVQLLTEGQSVAEPQVRRAIATARQKCTLPAAVGKQESDVTIDLYNKVLEWASKPEGSSCV